MIFKKSIEPRCAYCLRAKPMEKGFLACPKKGVVAENFSCRAFQYDPLKRQPPRPAVVDFSHLSDEDFSL